VITLFIVNHYYHFVYETVLQLYPLLEYNFFDKYPNATILCFYSNGFTANNLEMLNALKIHFPWNDVRRGRRDRLYTVAEGYNLVIARHNNFHTKEQENVEYNRNLLNLIRGRIPSQPANPDLFLYVSRQGIRRGIKQEWELYLGLKTIYPNLTFFFPDNHTVEIQKETFAKSRVIISPHGASLTNVLFSDWDILTLVELTLMEENPLTYRDNLWVKNHFVLQCQSIPCRPRYRGECKGLPMDVNITMAVQVIHEIIQGSDEGKNISKDYFIAASHANEL
jgi:Glycosyltransferase 61